MSLLRYARLKRGESADTVAAAVGVVQSQYTRIENGTRRPSPALANRIAKYFGNVVTRDQLLFPEDYTELSEKRQARSPRLQQVS